MKNKLSKIIALLLTVASLLSMFTVFAWADENEEEEGPEEEEIVVDFDVNEDWLYYRTYEDGWGPATAFPPTPRVSSLITLPRQVTRLRSTTR